MLQWLLVQVVVFIFFALAYHVLPLGEDSKERVMPLLNVNVQEPGTWQGATAEAANMSVQGVVVVFVLLQCTEDYTAARDVTDKLWHTVETRCAGKWLTKHWHWNELQLERGDKLTLRIYH